MDKPDDLEQLWKTQPVGTSKRGEEMRDVVLKKITAFDRMIRVRNTIESLAAIAVAGFFGYAAWAQRNWIEQLGCGIVAVGALWIIYYLRRHGRTADPSPDQTVASYRRALVLKYEHQIGLLRNVKFWYLLPMYVGLLTGTSGMLKEKAEKHPLTWTDTIPPLVYTVVFAAVWWLNEVYAVRKLQRLRTTAMSNADEETHPET